MLSYENYPINRICSKVIFKKYGGNGIMTVSELIEKLQKLDILDAQIVLKDSSGENLDIEEIESVLGFYYVIHPVSKKG